MCLKLPLFLLEKGFATHASVPSFLSMQTTFFEAFDQQRLARRSDPVTSSSAASGLKLTKLQSQFLARLKKLGNGTANEIAAGSESIRKRATELKRAGLVVVVGARRCTVTGIKASVYKLHPPTAATDVRWDASEAVEG